MIRTFRLRDFKGHRDTQLALSRFTMLVGDNASGKTSVLEALALPGRFGPSSRSQVDASFAPEHLLRRGSTGPVLLDRDGTQGGEPSSAHFVLQGASKATEPQDGRWRVELTGSLAATPRREVHASQEMVVVGKSFGVGWTEAEAIIGTAGLYRLRAERIAAAAYSSDPLADIEEDGTNTAVALASMKLGNDEAFQRVEDALRKLIPAVTRIRLRPFTVKRPGADPVVGSKIYYDFRGASGVPADGASHGTLIVTALLAILHGPRRPDLILLDDFDHALHPQAQMELVRMMKGLLALESFEGMQIVATTHSPYMLDELEPSDVHAFALRDDGTVATKRLSEHPDAEKTRGALKAGQLWSLDPERDWVLRG